ncbi:MAG: molecular chaperone HtpG [Deltaproteobacteria bacterium]|nr:molecular chaperone HtpG [Deltaproteobacteria bacterium]MBR5705598.1 molecular chaperone HtpG [Deltaproteobacteria bacterium]
MSTDGTRETGTISINTENIFPIIKKWLYSDKDIFLRELVSNGIDAISKLHHINVVEQLKLVEDYGVDITVDKDKGTLTVKDNGIGMTADEVRRYINQVAFSSAEEFLRKFKDVEDKNQIIGHFGMGFYSTFMVASNVEIDTLSYQDGAVGVHWSCDGSTAYTLEETDRKERGTAITLTLNDDEKEFLEPVRLREILKKYCGFLPYPVRLAGDQINDRDPLWTKPATEVSEDEYKSFYHKLYPFAEDPLFWIHLNIDFPFNLKGIVYFPRLNTEFDSSKNGIKLFCNQVFVSDNCPELIPEFLTPLQGCLDAPDLPLNVSRSYLQNEPQVRKIREVLTGRVAGKLGELAKNMETFVPIWEDIHPFIKYGMMRDDKFYEKVKDRVIFKVAGGKDYTTLPDYLKRAEETHDKKVFYTNDEAAQTTYLKMFQKQNLEVLVMDALIDSHFIQFLEMKNNDVTFKRVDSELTENLIEAEERKIITGPEQKNDNEQIEELFKEALAGKDHKIKVESLKDSSVPAMILLPEESRRFQELTRMMAKKELEMDIFKDSTFLVNSANPLVQNLVKMENGGRKDDARLLIDQIYDLACLAHKAFSKERMEAFLERSAKVLEMVSGKD